ncbi:MAG TPA: anti-sigma factor [Solirubrobacteraceae bacterium]|jgi:hypothetical protein
MNRSTDLTPDQSAVLSLLLRQHKSYAEVARLLSIEESAVRDRAYAAIATLGSGEGTSLMRAHREEIGDYLLSQRSDLSPRTRSYLLTLANARGWAQALREELQQISPEALPPIPTEAPRPPRPPAPERLTVADLSEAEPAEAAPLAAAGPPLPASRRAGALLLGVILIGVIVAVVLIVNGGGGGGKANSPAASASASTTTTASSSAKPTLRIDNQINIDPPEGSSGAKGVVYVVSESGQRAFYVVAEGLPPSHGFLYVAWLYNSQSDAKALGKAPAVKSNGRLRGVASLPSDASKFHRFILTRETSEHSAEPGPIVLSGPFALKSKHPPRTLSGGSPIEEQTSTG